MGSGVTPALWPPTKNYRVKEGKRLNFVLEVR